MSTVADKVLDEILSLPADARMDLLQKLLASLNLPIQSDLDRIWAEEAERRVSEIEKGDVKLIPGEEVFRKVRQKHQE